MRTIAVLKECQKEEKEYILSSIENDDTVVFFKDERELLASNSLETIDIVMGEPDIETVEALPNLRWLQMTWAGANKYISSKFLFENICLTSASGSYGNVISEYIIAGMLCIFRNIFLYRTQMENGHWDKIEKEDTLEGKRVLVFGTGDIGKETAKKLKCFSSYVIGINRSGNKDIDCFDEIMTIDKLDEQLPMADIVIITMPGTKETAGMFDKNRFSKMKKNAMLVNIGRGFIVDTDALTSALQNNMLGSAVIDVTDPEPLPANHPLRKMNNVVLTPHISGLGWGTNNYTRKKILDIFCENLKRDINGEQLKNIIDFEKGY